MKNDKIINAYNAIQPADGAQERVFEKAMQKQQKGFSRISRPATSTALKIAASLATAAAVICIMVLGTTLPTSPAAQGGNSFSLRAYAMDYNEDGSVDLREVNLTQQEDLFIFFFDGTSVILHTTFAIKCEGSNIESVTFYGTGGSFAEHHLASPPDWVLDATIDKPAQWLRFDEGGDSIVKDGVPVFENGAPALSGFINTGLGNELTLDSESLAKNVMLSWATDISDGQTPSETTIRAVATFTDGQTQEETLTLKHPHSMRSVDVMQEDAERAQIVSGKVWELIHSIPLEQCQVVEGTEMTLSSGETYFIRLGGISSYTFGQTQYDMLGMHGSFDERGMQILDSNLMADIGGGLDGSLDNYDGSDILISVIKKAADETYVFMVYQAPGSLVLELMERIG